MSDLSIVIPAYNESEDIVQLIHSVQKASDFPVIVVDDYSEAVYADMYRSIPNITLIRHDTNKGKTQAVHTGIQATTSEYILVLDADLHGVTANHIAELLLLAPSYDVLCLVRGSDRPLFKLLGATFITRGEHLLKRSFVEKHRDILFDGTRWGFDNNINDILRKESVTYKFCELEGVNHKVKAQKYPFFTGLLLDLKMFYLVPIKKYKLIFWITTYLSLLPKIRSRVHIHQ